MKNIAFVFVFLLVDIATFASPVKSSEAIKGLYYTESSLSIPTTADYIHDGLIAMWDGIENVKYGKHDSNAKAWIDLINGRQAILTSSSQWSDNALICSGNLYAANDGTRFYRDSVYQVEIVFTTYSSGLIATIARPTSGVRSAIYVCHTSSDFFAMGVDSSAAGLKNSIGKISFYQRHSISFRYNSTDLINAIVNGSYFASPFYTFNSYDFSTICFGGRAQWSDVPWKGEIHCIRIYSRQLSDEEVMHNYVIDGFRFNLQ